MSYGTGNILPILFPKVFGPSNSTFLFVFLALTMCDTVSFSAGHRIAIERRHIVIIKIIAKYVHVLKPNKRCVT